jgi:hypothetical protein
MDRTGKAALWLVAGHAAVLGLCCAGSFTQSDRVPDGQCSGLGWGCTLSPRDGWQIAIVLWGLPALTVSLLVCLVTVGVVAAVRDRRRKRTATARGPGSEAQRAVPGGSDGRAHDGPE